jgi:hypothetical protein
MLNTNRTEKCVDRPRKWLPGLRISPAGLLLLTVVLASAGPSLSASPAPDRGAPGLSVDNAVATAGFYSLGWGGTAQVELQEAAGPDFDQPVTVYTGPDRATVISGKPNGTWFYRIRSLDDQRTGPWSEPLTVTVAHHSLTRAFLFLGLGVIVFIATVLMIVRGSDTRA